MKHGGVYIRVHPCRLKLEEYRSYGKNLDCSKANTGGSHIEDNVHSQNIDEQSSSEMSDDEKEDTEMNRDETIIMEPNDQHISLGDARGIEQNNGDNTADTRNSNGVLKRIHARFFLIA